MKRVLITGAGGFVGRHLCRALTGQYEVWGLTWRSTRPRDAAEHLHWLTHDIRSALPADLPRKFHGVIHLAQAPGYREFPERAVEMFSVNCLGLQHALDFAVRAGVRVFVYASTGGIYGSGPAPFKETSPFNADGPLKPYLTTKWVGELLVASYAERFTPVILRPFFVYGTGQKPAMLIPRLVGAVGRGERIMLHGQRGIQVNPVHVSDAVAAIARALERTRPLTSNVVGPEVLHLREIADLIGKAVGKAPVFKVVKSLHPPHLVGDIRSMARELGQPKVTVADAIGEVCRDVL